MNKDKEKIDPKGEYMRQIKKNPEAYRRFKVMQEIKEFDRQFKY